MLKYGWILLLFIPLLLSADSGENAVDKLYSKVSKYILETSTYLDDTISKWLGYDEDNFCLLQKASEKKSDIDYFFLNNKYLNDTDDIYVRLRIKTRANSRGKETLRASLNAQLPFDKCKTQWKFFLQDINTRQNEVKTTDEFTGGIGLRYDEEKGNFGIKSSYSLGIHSGAPYIRGRFKYPFIYKQWKIEPVQIIRYSTKYHFEEETNIYFDRYPNDHELFRVQLHRKTASRLKGMDYGVSIRFYRYTGKNAGFELSQSFFGNTYYNDYYSKDPNYSGINNYVTSFGWRAKIWRDWLYCEIRPTVNFHKDNNYDPTYTLRFYLDFYFGKYD